METLHWVRPHLVHEAQDWMSSAGFFIRKLNSLRIERFVMSAAVRKIQRSWRKKKTIQQVTSPQKIMGSALRMRARLKSIAKDIS